MSDGYTSPHGGGASGGEPAGGERRGRPKMMSIGTGRNVGGGCIIPIDPGDGIDDGAKFRDLVWVPDDEKVEKLHGIYQALCYVTR